MFLRRVNHTIKPAKVFFPVFDVELHMPWPETGRTESGEGNAFFGEGGETRVVASVVAIF